MLLFMFQPAEGAAVPLLEWTRQSQVQWVSGKIYENIRIQSAQSGIIQPNYFDVVQIIKWSHHKMQNWVANQEKIFKLSKATESFLLDGWYLIPLQVKSEALVQVPEGSSRKVVDDIILQVNPQSLSRNVSGHSRQMTLVSFEPPGDWIKTMDVVLLSHSISIWQEEE